MNPGGNNNDLYNQIGPGFAAFVVIFLLAMAIWLLVRSMNGHLRNVRYAQADAEARERESTPGRETTTGTRGDVPDTATGGAPQARPSGE